MIQVGYEGMARQASKLKPASKTIVQAHLDKVRPNLPAKPVQPAAVVTAPSTVSKPKIVAQASKEIPKEDDDTPKAPQGKVVRAPSKTKVSR